jgi:uncharacterized protein
MGSYAARLGSDRLGLGDKRRRGDELMAGKFEIYQDEGGKFRFRLKAGNGEMIAVGQAYESKASVKNGVDSVKNNAADARVVDLTD